MRSSCRGVIPIARAASSTVVPPANSRFAPFTVAVAVLAVISTHLPSGLRTFLLTLAVVDDLLAILRRRVPALVAS